MRPDLVRAEAELWRRLIETNLDHCRTSGLLDVLVRTNEADEHLHCFYGSIGFTKLDITARQNTPTFSVAKRYLHQSLR